MKPTFWTEKKGDSYDTFGWDGPGQVTVYNMTVDKTTGKGCAVTKEFGVIDVLPRQKQLNYGPTVSAWSTVRGAM